MYAMFKNALSGSRVSSLKIEDILRLAGVHALVTTFLSPYFSIQYMRLFFSLLIFLWIGGTSAKLFLLVFTPTTATESSTLEINPIRPLIAVASEEVDIEQLITRRLFSGSANDLWKMQKATIDKPRGIESSAVETRLELELRGIVAFKEDGSGFAIIEGDGEQQLYMVGDSVNVKGPSRVILAKVMQNSVVLENAGIYELLTLFQKSDLEKMQAFSKSSEARKPFANAIQGEAPQAISKKYNQKLSMYRDKLYSDPASIMESIRVGPVTQQDSLIGYKVESSGDDTDLISLLGLRAGDIITEVNGIALDNPSNTISLYQKLKDSRSLNVNVLRDGRALSISIDMEDLETNG